MINIFNILFFSVKKSNKRKLLLYIGLHEYGFFMLCHQSVPQRTTDDKTIKEFKTILLIAAM